MEKKDTLIAIIFLCVSAFCAYFFNLDYQKIAESGLTLSSIVLAVYIAAIVGLINSDLAKKMKQTVASPQQDKTQLGVLVKYFKMASSCSIGTILISSLILVLPCPNQESSSFFLGCWTGISVIGFVLYAENLVFLTMIVRFMLNRQIWNT